MERMFRRRIGEEEVRHVLVEGEEIANYPEDTPHPSRLRWQGSRPIHVVVSEDAEGDRTFVITVYEPSPDHWEPGFRKRNP
jgi:hypothetical protein